MPDPDKDILPLRHAAILLLTAVVLLPDPTLGQNARNFGEVAEDLADQVTGVGQLAGVLAMVIGAAALIMAGLKFKSYSSNPQDPNASLPGAVGWLVAGSALVALPELMNVGVTSLFGGGQQPGTIESDIFSLQ